MSDVFQGPGWWLASDGKWYDPSCHPDAAYREEFSPAVAASVSDSSADLMSETIDSSASAVDTIDCSLLEMPDVAAALAANREPAAEPEPDVLDLRDSALQEPQALEEEPVSEELVEEESLEQEPLEQEPLEAVTEAVDEGRNDPEVAEEPPTVLGRMKLELPAADSHEREVPAIQLDAPVQIPSTELVHVPPSKVSRFDTIDGVDLGLLCLLFVGGLAVVAGTFLAWTTGVVDEIGWDRPDGIVAVVAGVTSATAVGPMFAGFRSVGRPVAIVAGVVALMVIGVAAVTTLTEAERTGLSIGAGIYVVLAGAIAVLAAAAGLRTNPYN